MATATLAPAPVAAFDVEDEMFDLDLRIVSAGPVVSEPTAGPTDTDNCVMTDKTCGGTLCHQ